jgi:hypothetical protein
LSFAGLSNLNFYCLYSLSGNVVDTLAIYMRRWDLSCSGAFGHCTNHIQSKPTEGATGQLHSYKKFGQVDKNPLTNYFRSVKSVTRKN